MSTKLGEINSVIESVELNNLHFDPLNPRFPSYIKNNDEPSILGWMLSDATIEELMSSIGEQGFFQGEPLLVIPSLEIQGDWIVVEGNRRLTALKLLNNPSLAKVRRKSIFSLSETARFKPNEIPVIKYIDRKEILEYLGYRHLTGVKPWGALEKARYLKQLYENTTSIGSEEKMKEVARTIGSRADYINRQLVGLSVFDEIEENAFFNLVGVNEETIDFSVLTTALSYVNISEFLNLNVSRVENITVNTSNLKELTDWLFREVEGKRRVGESRDLKILAKIVKSPMALEAFRGGEKLLNAEIYAEVPSEAFGQILGEVRNRLRDANNQISKVDFLNEGHKILILEIRSIAQNLATIVINHMSGEDLRNGNN